MKYFISYIWGSFITGQTIQNDEVEVDKPITSIEDIRDIEQRLEKLQGGDDKHRVSISLLNYIRME